MTTPVIFNTIDSDYKKTLELTNITPQEKPEQSVQIQQVQPVEIKQTVQSIQSAQIVQIEKPTPNINKLKNKFKLHTDAAYLQK